MDFIYSKIMAKQDKLYYISKKELQVAAHIHVLEHCSHLQHKVTKKLIAETLIFLEGFSRAINFSVESPVIVRDMKDLLLEEGLIYIQKTIN